MTDRVSRRRVADLVDCAVSWPGISIYDAAEELGVSVASIKTYAAAGRRDGLIWAGYVPRLVDMPEGLVPDVLGAYVPPFVREIHTRIATSWILGDPIRLHDLTVEGRPRQATVNALQRLRIMGAVMPAGTLYPTREGLIAACYSAEG